LQALGASAAAIDTVILTHLHYDHAGQVAQYPSARFVVQERELAFVNGRYMAHRFLRLAYETEDIERLLGEHFGSRLLRVDGDAELAPGLSVHWMGGHTDGLQVVRVCTAQGWMVLASDLFHYYANREHAAPFPIVFHVGDMLEGFEKVAALATRQDLIVPGHDPLVMQRFTRDARDAAHVVQLA
jgi:glyoxylase-like metal-dependent hydrolase (beta-lactamase superfamily II)